LIHAGRSRKWLDDSYPDLDSTQLVFGAVIGVVDLVNCVLVENLPDDWRDDPDACGPWCWLLANPRSLPKPYRCSGRLHLWDAPADLQLP
jgi:hypothetical protein